ncbi:MAG TPA: hypothetical protein DCZ94_08215 [Lentisphaeria bacterium]|nr:MAG: hypothetical protein A2X48_19695 [Lentisphaerae bacterium GWF2_49_21]HBC86921.1 hypothetical protein [Lentisphaeria bacterium]
MKTRAITLQLFLILVAGISVYLAATRCFITSKYDIPVAFTYQDDKLFVVEKSANTLLQLSGVGKDGGLKLEKRSRIEGDDANGYYMVRQMHSYQEGIIVGSYLYDFKTQSQTGIRYRKYRTFDGKPEDILTLTMDKMKSAPDLAICTDDKGVRYVLNNIPGRRNIWKLNVSGIEMRDGTLPAGITELGDVNTENSNWMGIAVDSEGHIFVTSGATGKVNEYSPDGTKLREIGTVGFAKDELLAASNVYLIKLPGMEKPLLTVASSGNRTWVQYGQDGKVVKVIDPLASGYRFPDILVNKIKVGKDGLCYSFDLANSSAIVIGEKIKVFDNYFESRWLLFVACMLAIALAIGGFFVQKRILALTAKAKLNFFLKFTVLFIPMLAASSYITGLWSSDIVMKNIQDEYIRRSANIANAILCEISIPDLRRIGKPEDLGSSEYEKIFQTAKKIADISKVEQTPKWIIHKLHRGHYYFGINNWRGPIYEPFIVPREREMFFKVLAEKKPQSGRFKDDQGEWFSYLAPITGENGEVTNVLELYRPTEALDRANSEIRRKVGFVMLATSLAAALVLLCFSYVFTRPLKTLIQGTRLVSKGDFEHRIEVRSRDEFKDLADSFNKMIVDLKKYTTDLAETTSQKEKIESELRIAHDIQMSIIPNIFPAFPHRSEFDIYAKLIPAKAVGGDLYDFFFLDESHFCFAIGDVAGKGVPASLYMAITKTLLRAKGAGSMDSGRIITEMNKSLSSDNSTCMFVTFFIGIIDLVTGALEFSNAGHPYPLILRNSGSLEKLENEHTMPPLGVFDSDKYPAGRTVLSPGDSILIYTDGVTEAANIKYELFDDDRMDNAFMRTKGLDSVETINLLFSEVARFTEGAEQSDDITALNLIFHGTGRIPGKP